VNVAVTCRRCETLLVVMPRETDPEFTAHLAESGTATGKRLAVADSNGRYTCPVCGTRGQLETQSHGE
jgi:hypothetical protein